MSQLLIITGTMGAGKTSVLAEASDILSIRNVTHAAIDVDALSLGHFPPAAGSDSVMYENLRSICKNYAALGVQRFILARALENQSHLDQCCEIVSATNAVVCRLTAGIQEMQRRVALREPGTLQRQYTERVAILDSILDRAHLEDFVVINENRPITDVALEVLVKARWTSL